VSGRRRVFPIKGRYLAVLLVGGWALYYHFHLQSPQLQALQSKAASLQGQLAEAEKEHARLVKQAQEFQNDDFIARYASERYNLILPGQVAFDVKH